MYTTLTTENLPTLFALIASVYAVGGECTVLLRSRRSLLSPVLALSGARGSSPLGFELVVEESFSAGNPDPYDRHTLMVSPDPAFCVFSYCEGYELKGQYNLPEYLAFAQLDGLDVVVLDRNGDPLPFRAHPGV